MTATLLCCTMVLPLLPYNTSSMRGHSSLYLYSIGTFDDQEPQEHTARRCRHKVKRSRSPVKGILPQQFWVVGHCPPLCGYDWAFIYSVGRLPHPTWLPKESRKSGGT